jgi:NAD(P)-dependent dehydrogenase (short-subunit alcohol dehydrogenase family)
MQKSLQNTVALVTGSARRVGRAIALEFARQGANVVIHHSNSAQDAESAAQEARALGVQAMVVRANQTDLGEVWAMFEAIKERFGRLDVLVNSAASFKHGDLLEIGFEEWQEVIGTNLTGPFLCTQQAAKLMISGGRDGQSRGGAIINISDNSGLKPWASRPHHSIAKAGVIQLTQVAALALAPHNIRVNCVVPGPVLRPAGEPESALEDIAKGLPLGRIGNPDDIARACVFLATNDFATGTIMRVDGGEGLVGGET